MNNSQFWSINVVEYLNFYTSKNHFYYTSIGVVSNFQKKKKQFYSFYGIRCIFNDRFADSKLLTYNPVRLSTCSSINRLMVDWND